MCARAALLVLLCLASPLSAQTYQLIELQKPEGYYARGEGLDESGAVVGNTGPTTFEFSYPVVWQNGVPTALAEPGLFGGAYSINESGAIIGTLQTTERGLTSHATIWNGGEPMFIEPPLTLGYGEDINDAGEACGFYQEPSEPFWRPVAYRWVAGTLTTLPETPGARGSVAKAINNGGDVAGWIESPIVRADSSLPPVAHIAALWRDGALTLLGDIPDGGSYSQAWEINDSGVAVGYAYDSSGVIYAVRWDDGVPTRLAEDYSLANDINSSGAIVGWAVTLAGQHAVLWTGGTMNDLNDMIESSGGCELTVAFAINDRGQIVARGRCPGDSAFLAHRSFLLTPDGGTPEERLAQLKERLDGLGLQPGIANSFHSMIDAALASLARDMPHVACNQLSALVNAVSAHKGKALSAADADAITEEVESILVQIGC